MIYVKAFIFTTIASLVMGFGLAYLQADKEYETTVQIQSKETKEFVETFTFSTFPNVKAKYNQKLTGKGKVIYDSELYSPIFVKVEAQGYKTKRGFYLWKASDENTIYLEPIETTQNDEQETPSEPVIDEKEKEKEKVDMFPTFK